MKRRDAVELIVIGAAAAPLSAQEQHQHAPVAPAAAPPAGRFLSPAQHSLTDTLAEMIIPADKHSGGAREAKVADFIDDYLASATDETRKAWASGLAAVDAEARKRHGKEFTACTTEQRDAILKDMADGEGSPKTDLHHFFVRIKTQTLSGYYTSSVGLLKDLQYKGIVPIAAYPACEHPEHQKAGR